MIQSPGDIVRWRMRFKRFNGPEQTLADVFGRVGASLKEEGWFDEAEAGFSTAAIIFTVQDAAEGVPAFFVTSDMTEVVGAAASTLPVQSVAASDWRVPHGVLFFARPVEIVKADDMPDIPVIGISWRPDRDKLHLSRYVSVDGDVFIGAMEEWPSEDPSPAVRCAIAALLLMHTKLAAIEGAALSHALRRQAARRNVDTNVTVMTLRQREYIAESDHRAVDWQHRWLVSAHWRNQWVPSESRHRPTLIPAHVKGPADKPLVIRQKIKAFVR